MRRWLASLSKTSSLVLFRSNLLALLAALIVSGSVSAQSPTQTCDLDNPAKQLLNKMLQAPSTLAFEGTVLYERAQGRQFLTVTWPHASGTGVLRRMNAAADPVAEPWPAPIDSPRRICDVIQVYIPTLDSGPVVAGRQTRRLTLRPRDTLRLAHRIDVDAETGMALAMATAGPEGQMLERYEYAAIDYAEMAPDSGLLSLPPAAYLPGRSVVPGYFLVSQDADNAIFVVSDGLATASIFVEPLPAGAPLGEGAIIEGATLTYTRGTAAAQTAGSDSRSADRGLLISVLGEVPLVTARLLADAVRPPAGSR